MMDREEIIKLWKHYIDRWKGRWSEVPPRFGELLEMENKLLALRYIDVFWVFHRIMDVASSEADDWETLYNSLKVGDYFIEDDVLHFRGGRAVIESGDEAS
jgi:hypothetical protein